jgi:hypothetical protein
MNRHVTTLLASERIAGLQAEAGRERLARTGRPTAPVPGRGLGPRWRAAMANIGRSRDRTAVLRS